MNYCKGFIFAFLVTCSIYSAAQTISPLKRWLSEDPKTRQSFRGQSFANAALSRKEAGNVASLLMDDQEKQLKGSLANEWNTKVFREGEHEMKFEYKIFGERPKDGRSLFISMHGGGNTPASVNDQQWKNQLGLYRPVEGVYVAPRAPTNTWNLWHEQHIDSLFDKLIEAAVTFENVNPDKVYLMGYSAGGDGVYQLAARMADRWAAAAMMAGHPNETSPLGLRNIGFAIHVGALDSGFNRNQVAARWGVMLDSLQQQDKEGYQHVVQLHQGRTHWMNREDTIALPWLINFKRNPVPARVAWKQDDVNHLSFYWLAVPQGSVKSGGEIIASYKDNEVNIEKNYSDTLVVFLNDKMMDLDKDITVNYLGGKIFSGKLQRSPLVIYETIEARKDPGLVFSTKLWIVNGKAKK